MASHKNDAEAREARDALDAVGEAGRAGLGVTIPPRWFGVVIALITGALVASTASGNSQNVILLVLAFAVVIAVRNRKAGASVRSMPTTLTGYLALFGVVVIFLVTVAACRIGIEVYGFKWAPIAGGAFVGLLVYGLSLSERRTYINMIDGEGEG